MGVIELRRAILLNDGLLVPPEYQRVDYLQCTGYTAKIDTGVFGDDNTLSFDFTYMPVDQANYAGHIGNYTDENTRCWRFIQSTSSYPATMIFNSNARRAGSSNSIKVVDSESFLGHKIHVYMSYGYLETKGDDGRFQQFTQTTDGTTDGSTKNISIGSPSLSNTGGTVRARFYDTFKIMKSGILIRNYIPCYRKSDSKAGFYDTVNHTFNPSIGSADFVAGND